MLRQVRLSTENDLNKEKEAGYEKQQCLKNSLKKIKFEKKKWKSFFWEMQTQRITA